MATIFGFLYTLLASNIGTILDKYFAQYWLYGVHIGATWRIRLNRPCAAAMRPYVKLLWPLVVATAAAAVVATFSGPWCMRKRSVIGRDTSWRWPGNVTQSTCQSSWFVTTAAQHRHDITRVLVRSQLCIDLSATDGSNTNYAQLAVAVAMDASVGKAVVHVNFFSDHQTVCDECSTTPGASNAGALASEYSLWVHNFQHAVRKAIEINSWLRKTNKIYVTCKGKFSCNDIFRIWEKSTSTLISLKFKCLSSLVFFLLRSIFINFFSWYLFQNFSNWTGAKPPTWATFLVRYVYVFWLQLRSLISSLI